MTVFKASAPIEIPSRHRSMSPPKFCTPSIRPSSTITELLFEMSPFDCDATEHSSKASINPSSPDESEFLFSANRASIRNTYCMQSSFSKIYRKNCSPCSSSSYPLRKKPSRETYQSNDVVEAVTHTPSVIRTTAIHKISGFAPINPSPVKKPQDLPIRLHLTPSSNNSLFSYSCVPPATEERRDNKSSDDGLCCGQSVDLEKFLVLRFERRRIRPHFFQSRT
ncbi:hypothetical protein BDP27DRAFT_1327044 [Rhodocollybia butyracea]|uniref:Uncharacterized protein n=1 Tax=Rhodocollybia butyracea TaxID=206335 RepID=A0A9P5U697_9AGAR|nr:hypothetical protein BDP27DRAFT_1327044 [Rhodocollybia butyracea]